MDDLHIENDQLNEVLAEYLVRIDRGDRVNRENFLAEHPEFAGELLAFFDDCDAVANSFEDTEASGEPTREMPQVLGDYRLLGKLGAGMGTVYRARHVRLDRLVALKLLSKRRTADPVSIARFEREMRAVGRFSHPNIVQALDARDVDGTIVLVMECVDGIDLSDLIGRVGALPFADACELIRQTAIGLQYAHERGLVHRDIKPSNLMVTPAGQVKILDLGLALFDTERRGGGELTSDGQAMGSADYMAPEQAGDSHNVDIRADIYSLGCTFFKLLTARSPFAGPSYETPLDKMIGHARDSAPSPSSLRVELPPELDALVKRMMAKDPASRFSTPAELCEAITPFAAGSDLASLIARASSDEEPQSSLKLSGGGTGKHLSSHQTDTVSRIRRSAPRASKGGRFRRPRLLLAAAAGALFVLGAILTVATDRGTLKIKTFDDDVKVVVSQDGRDVAIVDAKTGKTVNLRSGQYDLKLVGGKKSLSLDTENFTLRRGDTVIVEVENRQAEQFADERVSSLVEGCDLKELDLSDTKVTDADLLRICRLRKMSGLKRIFLNRTRISDEGIERLAHLTNLEELGLFATKISDTGLKNLQSLKKLSFLDIGMTSITDDDLSDLASLNNLKQLRLGGSLIDGHGLMHLQHFTQLEELFLGHSKVTDENMRSLEHLTSLRILWLNDTVITDAGIERLQNLGNLQALILERTVVTDAGLASLRKLKFLQMVNLQGTRVTAEALADFHHAVPACSIGANDEVQAKLKAILARGPDVPPAVLPGDAASKDRD